nr:peroxidase 20 [Fagopyrum tataricum]
MEIERVISSLMVVAVVALAIHGNEGLVSEDSPLIVDFYKETCPALEEIVRYIVKIAVLEEPRIAASLLRLHFHDCFVLGCDGSILLDDQGGMVSEKKAGPNLNSVRGFGVIDKIKYAVEEVCPLTVSCADILAIVARDAVVLRGGPSWEVPLGRRDSLRSSIADANKMIPSPNSSLAQLVANFEQHGLDPGDLVALSGSHTMGMARCLSFAKRLYDPTIEENHDPRYSTFQRSLRSICPAPGNSNRVISLDYKTPFMFDNYYFKNLIEARGLLHSDNVLVLEDNEEGFVMERVWAYAYNQKLFFESFSNSMVKMGNINVLTGEQGEIRKYCRFVNT